MLPLQVIKQYLACMSKSQLPSLQNLLVANIFHCFCRFFIPRLYLYLQQYKAQPNETVSFCSSFKALSTDASFIEIGICYQKLSALEFYPLLDL